jgi:hypothetical protein
MRLPVRAVLAFLGLALLLVPSAQAQAQGLAVIITPLEGATVSGSVPILGTATHSQFTRYELAFGYNSNPTDTWFSIQDPVQAQVVNDVLGRWDTTGVTDGVYTLRLRVYSSERVFNEALARGIRVQNATPTPPPPAPAEVTAAPLAPVPSATPIIVLPPTSTPRPTTAVVSANSANRPGSQAPSWFDAQAIFRAAGQGLLLTALVFVVVGLYAGFKAALRHKPKR